MATERFYYLTSGAASVEFDSVAKAITAASKATDKDRVQRQIVRVVAEVRPRQEPNVDVHHYEGEQAHG